MIVKNLSSERFYLGYRYNDGKDSLRDDKIKEYTNAASWLNMLMNAQADKKLLKNTLGMNATAFWTKVGEIITADNIGLPANYIRLIDRIKQYKDKGYAALIHKQFGNTNAQKVNSELAQDLLIELIAMPNANDVTTCFRYNTWAAANNHEQITPDTVGKWRRNYEYLISAQKYGTKETYNKYGKQILRNRASVPLACVEHDDNELDLFFKSTKNKKGSFGIYYFNRFVIAVVVDTFNDYILGWAIAETYTKELIRLAYLDAIIHIRQLTGDYYLPYQIRCDRFGLDVKLENDLAHFYKSLAIFTPATAKVARGKYIEQSFGNKWHEVLGTYKNYAGKNVKSGGLRNDDLIELNKRDFPDTEKATEQIGGFINIMRHLVDEKTGLSKQEQWVKAFEESERSRQKKIDDVQLYWLLGTRHEYKNKITNRGITPAINCVDRTYEIPEEHFLETIGKKVQVIYNPFDYSQIMVSNDDGLRLMCKTYDRLPSAIMDFREGDRRLLNDRLEEKKQHMLANSNAKDKRRNNLEQNRIQAEGFLQAGINSKALKQQATLTYQSTTNRNDADYNPLDDM